MSGWGDGTWSDGGWGGTQPLAGSVASGNTGILQISRANGVTGSVASGNTGNLGVKISVGVIGSGALGSKGTLGYAYWTKINTSQTPNWTPIISI